MKRRLSCRSLIIPGNTSPLVVGHRTVLLSIRRIAFDTHLNLTSNEK